MKAAVRTKYGPPEVVRLEEVDKPTPGDDELLIKVRATTVNRTDCGYRGGTPFPIRFFSGLRRPKVDILGTEFAGEVEAVGTDVTSHRAGDRVCGYCEGTFGAHAEYMTIGAERLIARIPEDSTFEEAAPSTEGSHYALGMLRRANIGDEHDVLIYGATGAIGSAAVQIAKSLGANVTAVCGTKHVAMVEGLGADRVIDYQTTDFTKDEQKYDLVLDAVGKSSFRRCRRLLKRRAIYISSDVGLFWHGPMLALITPLFRGRKLIFVTPRRDPEAIRYLKGLIESGEFKPVIDRQYSLDQIVEAYRYVETGQKIGNVVIAVEWGNGWSILQSASRCRRADGRKDRPWVEAETVGVGSFSVRVSLLVEIRPGQADQGVEVLVPLRRGLEGPRPQTHIGSGRHHVYDVEGDRCPKY